MIQKDEQNHPDIAKNTGKSAKSIETIQKVIKKHRKPKVSQITRNQKQIELKVVLCVDKKDKKKELGSSSKKKINENNGQSLQKGISEIRMKGYQKLMDGGHHYQISQGSQILNIENSV